jgi:hypothetical protein
MKREKKKVTTVAVKPSLIEQCKKIDPNFNLSRELETMLVGRIVKSLHLIEDVIRAREDVVYFAERFCKVTTLGEVVDVQLDDDQRAILREMAIGNDCGFATRRQSGLTTLLTIYALHNLLFGNYLAMCLVNTDHKRAHEGLERVRDMFYRLPEWLQSSFVLTIDQRARIECSNGNGIYATPDDSDFLKGRTVDKIFVDNSEYCTRLREFLDAYIVQRPVRGQIVCCTTR